MSQQSQKQEWLNRQVSLMTELLKNRIFIIAGANFILFIIIFFSIYITNGSFDISLKEVLIIFVILIIPYGLLFIVYFTMLKVKNELLKVNIDNVDTIKVEVFKVRYSSIPSSRYTIANPYLVIKYRYKEKKYKGYYFPLNHISDSPKELKNKLSKLKRINIYRNTNIIECIEFYDNDFIF